MIGLLVLYYTIDYLDVRFMVLVAFVNVGLFSGLITVDLLLLLGLVVFDYIF